MKTTHQHSAFASRLFQRTALICITFAACLVADRASAAGEIDYVVTSQTDPVQPNQTLEFDVTVHNLTASSQSVSLNYVVPQYTKEGVFGEGTPRSHDFGSLSAGQSVTWRLFLTVLGTASVPDGSVITLILNDLARATSVSRSVVARDLPALGLDLSTEFGTVSPGSTFSYTLAAANITLGSLPDVVLTLPVPAGATFVSADGGGTLSGGVVTWNFGALAAGANEQVHVTLQAPSGSNPMGPLEAMLTDGNGNVARASDARVLTAAPVFQYIVTTERDPAQPDQPLQFRVTAHNLTNSSQSIVLNYTVPQYTKEGVFSAGTPRSLDFGTLSAGQSLTKRVFLTVLGTGLVPDGGTIRLQVFDLARAASAMRVVVIRDVPVLGLNLSTEQGTVEPGGNFTYTLAAANISGGSQPGAVLSLPVPMGTTFVSADGGGTLSGGVVSWNLGTLEAGANKQLHVTLQANTGGDPLSPINAMLLDSNGHVARVSDGRVVIAAPVLQYLVTTARDPRQPDQPLEFHVTAHNLTNSSQSIILYYSVPQFTKEGVFGAGTARSLDFGTLVAGQSNTKRVFLTVLGTASAPEGGSITLNVFDLSRAASVSRTVVVRDVPTLDLALSTEDGSVSPGDNFTYTLAAGNVTVGSLTAAVLSLPVPAGASFVSADGGGTLNGGVVTWNLGTLGAGANEQVHVTLQAGAGDTPLGSVNAMLTDSRGDIARASDTQVVIASPIFEYTISPVQDPVQPNQKIEFDVTVHNLAPSSQSLVLYYTVPQYTEEGVFHAGIARSHDFGTLTADQSITWQLFLTVLDPASAPEGGNINLQMLDLNRGASVSRTVVVRSNIGAPATPHFANISTRMFVGTGDNVLIGGFINTGLESERVILRAIGPSLPLSGVLADPVLTLYDGSGQQIATNDNWKDSLDEQAIIDSGLAPTKDKESAILISLPPGAYTTIVAGAGDKTGVGLVEIYDLEFGSNGELANISTRGLVKTGDNVLIGGIIILGDAATKIIVRAIGPSLPVSGPLADPILELHNVNGDLIFSNDNWRDTQEDDLIATGLQPSQDEESAIVATLDPGAYTAIVRGKDNTTGVALVEAYDLE